TRCRSVSNGLWASSKRWRRKRRRRRSACRPAISSERIRRSSPSKSGCSRGTSDVFFRQDGHVGATASPSFLPDTSPTWGEISCHHHFRQSPASKELRQRR